LSDENQCHGADERKRAGRPSGFHPAVERVGEMRVAAGNLSAPDVEKLAKPDGRLRAVRPKQTDAQKGHGLSNTAKQT
jgi:hypothetical protein